MPSLDEVLTSLTEMLPAAQLEEELAEDDRQAMYGDKRRVSEVRAAWARTIARAALRERATR